MTSIDRHTLAIAIFDANQWLLGLLKTCFKLVLNGQKTELKKWIA